MNKSPVVLRNDFLERTTTFLWQQWTTLGVAGTNATSRDQRIIDPEALLVFTCSLARYEPRLFDEVLDWLRVNGSFLSVARLKRILKEEGFSGRHVLAAMVASATQRADASKWRHFTERNDQLNPPQPLFYLVDGTRIEPGNRTDEAFARYGLLRRPLALRGYSKRFQPASPGNLTLQLRALVGTSARSDIISYLLTHDAAHPSEIARDIYYYHKSTQDALVAMHASGVIRLHRRGREKLYSVIPEPWLGLLDRRTPPQWVTWPPLLRALEQTWEALSNERFLRQSDALIISSDLRELMHHIRPQVERAGFGRLITDDSSHLGEAYIEIFVKDINRLLDHLLDSDK